MWFVDCISSSLNNGEAKGWAKQNIKEHSQHAGKSFYFQEDTFFLQTRRDTAEKETVCSCQNRGTLWLPKWNVRESRGLGVKPLSITSLFILLKQQRKLVLNFERDERRKQCFPIFQDNLVKLWASCPLQKRKSPYLTELLFFLFCSSQIFSWPNVSAFSH